MVTTLNGLFESFVRLKEFPWAGISALAAIVALVFTARSIRQATRTRELQIFRDIFKDILKLQTELQTAAAEKQIDSEKFRVWFDSFLQTLEYFAFLWNHQLLGDRRLTAYFDTAVVHWYEAVFLIHATEEEKADGEPYAELKTLYKRLASKKGKRK
jgi:hypothetical protein